jgi:acyl-CoA synthetase (AMP-forming)/AMP-acid ligase II
MRLTDLPVLRFVDATRRVESLRLADRAGEVAARAAWLSVRHAPGSVIGLALRTEPALVIAWFAALAAGMRPLILQYPTVKQTRAYWRGSVTNTVELTGMAAIVGDQRVADMLEGSGIAVIAPDFAEPGDHAPVDALPRFSILQLSSGTTGHRKAVEFHDWQLEAHVRDYNRALELTPERDHVVSWLPLYHDMGYIACFVMPLMLGIPTTLIDAETWVADRPMLFEVIEEARGTICYMPNFGFETLAIPTTRDLSSMRRWISCSEPVFGNTVRRFVEATGVAPETFAACYAMAENVFAVSISEGLVEREIEGETVVSCGPPIPGVDLKIVEGEIWAKSPASIERYWNGDDIRDAEGFYPTGDMGAIVEGELHVTGRRRDVLIQAGKKYMLSTIDAVVNEVLPEVKGRAAAVVLRDERVGTEKPAVLIEAADFYARADAPAVAEAIQARTGLDFLDVRFVPPRFLTKTSSGKINRAISARDWVERERVDAAGRRRDPAAEVERVFGTLPQDAPVGEVLDSLSLTLLRIILTDADIAYDPEATLAGLRAQLAAMPGPSKAEDARPLRIVSLADRRSMRAIGEADLLAFAERLGRPVSFEHVCLPPTPVLLSDLVFYDYFRARVADQSLFEAVARTFEKLRGADVLVLDDAAEMHFPLTQFYPVLSHRLERSAEADLLAFRWQRYVEFHDRLPVQVVPGRTLPIEHREATIAALSAYLGVPVFRIASVQAFAPFTKSWEWRPLHSLSGGPGLKPHKAAVVLAELADWLEPRLADGSIQVPEAAPEVVRLDMTDLAHFCSHGVDRAGLDRVLAAYDHFCIVGQPASVAYIRRALTEAGKSWVEAPSYHPMVLATLPPFDCILSCGPTGMIETDRPAVAVMGAGWGGVRALNSDLPADIELRGKLPAADLSEWYVPTGAGEALDKTERRRVRDGKAQAVMIRTAKRDARERGEDMREAARVASLQTVPPSAADQRKADRQAARKAARRGAGRE